MNNNFKKSLLEGEEIYDPKAWDNLSKKLDQVMPTHKTNLFSNLNLIVLSLSVIAIGSGIYLYTQNSKTTLQSNFSQKENAKTEAQSNQTINSVNNSKINSSKINVKAIENPTSDNNVLIQSQSIQNHKNETSTFLQKNEIEETKITQQEERIIPERNFIAPKFKSVYCPNQEIILTNENESSYELIDENGKVIKKVGVNETEKITLSRSGKYFIKNKNNEFNAFQISHHSDFDIEAESDVTYENGLPIINLSTAYTTNQIEWNVNKGAIIEQDSKTKLLPFKKGKYIITLTQIDFNNCKHQKSTEITINEAYNLLAPTAFKPKDSDPRVNKFIPFALTQRDVKFEMYIIDPLSDQIIFKTNSAEHAWDGNNQQTGSLVPFNKSYVWKVRIFNPHKGEDTDYSGTVIVL